MLAFIPNFTKKDHSFAINQNQAKNEKNIGFHVYIGSTPDSAVLVLYVLLCNALLCFYEFGTVHVYYICLHLGLWKLVLHR